MELIVKKYLGSCIQFKMVNNEVYANATAMCKAFNKIPKDWLRNEQTNRYIEALKRKDNMPNEVISIVQGGISTEQGTWVHEKLILKLAQWLDVDFEIWCDEQIAALIREGKVSLNVSSYMIDDPIKRAEKWIEEQKQHKLDLEEKQKVIEYKEDVIIGLVEDIDLSTKRQRITQIIRHNSKNYSDRYNLLYTEFEKKYHCNLEARMNTYNSNNKPKVKNKMDYIDKGMNKIPQLYELCVKIFENDVEKLKKQWFDTIGVD